MGPQPLQIHYATHLPKKSLTLNVRYRNVRYQTSLKHPKNRFFGRTKLPYRFQKQTTESALCFEIENFILKR